MYVHVQYTLYMCIISFYIIWAAEKHVYNV